MINFLTGCSGLFTAVFDAAWAVDFFRLLFGYIVFQLSMGLFACMSKELRKL